jgi:Arc/MetJ family transcription regulator
MGVEMRTNIDIDDDLLKEAFAVSSSSETKKDIIHEALREFIRIKKRKDMTELSGKIEFYSGFNHKRHRKLSG